MIGLIFLGIIVVYLIIVIAAPFIGRHIAKAFNAPPAVMKWAGLAGFLAVTLPVFWDWIPTVMTHTALCKKDAGVFVYKTVEQWKIENPGVAETLTYKDWGTKDEPIADGRRYLLNQRIAWETRNLKEPWGNWRREEAIVDQRDGAVLARYRNYSTAVSGSLVGGSGGGLRDWKLWMSYRTCEKDEQNEPLFNGFSKLTIDFKKIGNK
jgi:hypothetical protein